MIYDYVVVDSKLLAYNGFHRRQHATHMLKVLVDALKYNKIRFKKVLYAADWGKSSYRLGLQPDYKGHRDEIKSRSTKAEQNRREAFLKDYNNLHKIFDCVGYNLQPTSSTLEADDLRTVVKHLHHDSNILLISLDADWFYDLIDTGTDVGNVHILKYTKNELYKSGEDVQKNYEIPYELLPHFDALTGQKKDNILGLNNMAKARFLKHLASHPIADWWKILEDLMENGTYKLHVHPEAKYKTIFQQYQHNLLMMSAAPIEVHKPSDIQYVKDTLEREPTDTNYEDFLKKCIELYGVIPPITQDDFRLLKYGTEN